MTLIESFLAFCNAKNMQQAAATIRISQPALTSHLKQFENYFNQDIFYMEGRKKTLTPFGRDLNQILQMRFANLDLELDHLNKSYEAPDQVHVRIAGRYEVIDLIAGKINSPGTIEFIQANSQQAAEGLLDRKYDLAITNNFSKTTHLHGKKLFSETFCVLLPSSWELRQSKISRSLFEELLSRPYLSYKEKDENLARVLAAYQITSLPKFKLILSHWGKISELVSEEKGWTICPRGYSEKGKVRAFQIPTNIIPETNFYYLYRKEAFKLQWFKTLLDELKAI